MKKSEFYFYQELVEMTAVLIFLFGAFIFFFVAMGGKLWVAITIVIILLAITALCTIAYQYLEKNLVDDHEC
jgi:predicted signal transduction protein with EAL and GGDEF domain